MCVGCDVMIQTINAVLCTDIISQLWSLMVPREGKEKILAFSFIQMLMLIAIMKEWKHY